MTPRFSQYREFAIFLGSYDANRPTDLYYMLYFQQPHLCARSDYYEINSAIVAQANDPHITDPELLEAQKRAICRFLPLTSEQI